MSPVLPSARHLRCKVITLHAWPTHGSSRLAELTDTASLMTCIYSTSRPRRTSPKSQVSALMHNYKVPSLSRSKEGSQAVHASPHISFIYFSFGHFPRSPGVMPQLLLCCGSYIDHIPTRMLVVLCFVKFVLQRLLLSSRHTLSFRSIMCPIHLQGGDRRFEHE
jgi:hypothetical protein